MKTLDEEFVKMLIYDKTKEEVLDALDCVEIADILHIYINNYNWDNGFEIPTKILSKTCCELSTALLIFYLAEGIQFLEDKNGVRKSNLNEWANFIENLYNQIMVGKFKKGHIYFEPPLSKIQLYKLEKTLNEEEEVFVEIIGNRKLDIYL